MEKELGLENEKIVGKCTVKIEGYLLDNGEEKFVITNKGCEKYMDHIVRDINKKFNKMPNKYKYDVFFPLTN